MTIEECREYLPESWLEPIQKDPALREIFEGHEYELEHEAAPPFLIQELRGGNLERLRPILALYGQPGLDMLAGLLEIDEAAKDTAEFRMPDGTTAYAGYFFTRPKVDQREAVKTAKRYLRTVCQVYEEFFHEPSPVGPKAGVLLLTGQEARDLREKLHQDFVQHRFHPGDEIYEALGDWFRSLEYQGNGGELADLLSEALYHINNDYFLSYYLQWPLIKPLPIENPFRPHFELWKMGLHPLFFHHDQMALIDC